MLIVRYTRAQDGRCVLVRWYGRLASQLGRQLHSFTSKKRTMSGNFLAFHHLITAIETFIMIESESREFTLNVIAAGQSS
jgi:hypothetical protein